MADCETFSEANCPLPDDHDRGWTVKLAALDPASHSTRSERPLVRTCSGTLESPWKSTISGDVVARSSGAPLETPDFHSALYWYCSCKSQLLRFVFPKEGEL